MTKETRDFSEPYRSRAPKLGFVGPLDGIRAIAVGMVMAVHLLGTKAGSFVGGVDLFMVVSGFLITTLLLQEHRSTGQISIRKFYVRRALRLLPALYVVLLFTLVLGALAKEGRFFSVAVKEVVAAFFYMYHVVFAATLGGATDTYEGVVVHFLPQLWSLSVEEHFYFVVAGMFAVAIRRNWVRQLGVAAALFVLVALVSRATGHIGPLYFWLQRPDSLVAGVLAAIINAEMPTTLTARQTQRLKVLGSVGALCAGVSLFASTSVFNKLGIAWRWTDLTTLRIPEAELVVGERRFGMTWTDVGFSAISIGFIPAVIALVRCPDWLLGRWLSIKPFRFIGRLSYTIYIWHVPWFIAVVQFENVLPAPVLLVLALGGTLGISMLSYRFIETPALRLKMRYAADPDSLDLTKLSAEPKAPADPST